MKHSRAFLGFCAFAILCGALLALYVPGHASGPGPIPFVPQFGTGAPVTPPVSTNQTYSDSSANYATYLYQSSALTWRKISNGGAGSGVTWPLTGDVILSTGTDTPGGLAPVNGACLQGNATPAWIVAACPTGASVTWPANGSAVISNTTNSPTGIAESDGKVLVGITGAWAAGSVPIATVTGGICTVTNFSIQFDNTGAMGCAPAIVNSGVFDFTGTTWQVGGTVYFNVISGDTFAIGPGALSLGGTTGTDSVCIGVNACKNLSGGNTVTAIGDSACGDNGANVWAGAYTVCLGFEAGQSMRTGGPVTDTWIGALSGLNNSGAGSTGLGYEACAAASNSFASQSTCIGALSGLSLAATTNDTLFGYQAGESITSGQGDLCIGFSACQNGTSITTGSGDIVINTGLVATACGASSVSVNSEFDLCGNANGDTLPIVRANITSIVAGNWKFNVPDASPGFVVSALPAAPPTGSRAYVTDAVACTFLGTLTGGSTTFCPVIYNGTAWVAS